MLTRSRWLAVVVLVGLLMGCSGPTDPSGPPPVVPPVVPPVPPPVSFSYAVASAVENAPATIIAGSTLTVSAVVTKQAIAAASTRGMALSDPPVPVPDMAVNFINEDGLVVFVGKSNADGTVQGDWQLKKIAGAQTLVTKAFDGATIVTYDTITVIAVLPPPVVANWVVSVAGNGPQSDTTLAYDGVVHVTGVDSNFNLVAWDVTWTLTSITWTEDFANDAGKLLRDPACTFDNSTRLLRCEPATWGVPQQGGLDGSQAIRMGHYTMTLVSTLGTTYTLDFIYTTGPARLPE